MRTTADLDCTPKLKILLALILSLHLFVSSTQILGQVKSKPNILVIMVDDLGYGDLSCYGAKDLKTPYIDGLAAEGLKFSQFYANCPVCSPTRASLITGRYPELVGVPGVIRTHAANNWGYLDPSVPTLPDMMKRAGYETAMVGKWHLGLESPNTPNERGFAHFHGFLGDMMDDYYHHRRHGNDYMRLNGKLIRPQGHATDLFSQWACDYLESRKQQSKPFFLYLAYNAPHTPIQPPVEWEKRVREREKGIKPARAKLVGLIEHMDDGIGRVLDKLDQLNLADDTLVVFTSDNGGQISVGANNGAHRDGKQSMYEGGLKVSTCVRWPNVTKKGITNYQGITMDLYPTLCEIVGIKVEHKIDGVSFAELLQGKPMKSVKRDLFFHRREGGLRYGGLTINAIRRGDWKLLQNSPFAPLELYNLKQDPLEKTNMTKKAPRIYREMATALRAQIQRGGRVPWQKPVAKSEGSN